MRSWPSRALPSLIALFLAYGALETPSAAADQSGNSLAKEIERLGADLRKLRQNHDKALQDIEKRLDRLKRRLPSEDQAISGQEPKNLEATASESGPLPSPQPATVCGEGCEFTDLRAAIKAAESGGVITVAPGLHGFCGVVDKPLTLRGLKDEAGKRAHLAGGVCMGKGPLVLQSSDIVIEGFEISNVAVSSRNGACIRIDPQAGDITIRDIYCHDSETGILGGSGDGKIVVEDSLFERNGANKGRAHGIYIGKAESFELRRSQVLSTKEKGHSLKSGALTTIVEDSVLAALDGENSRAIDAYGGGKLEVRRSVIQQGKNSDNHDAIGIALQPKNVNPEPHETLVEDNWIIFDDLERCCRWLFRAKQFGPVIARDNQIVGMTDFAQSPLNTDMERNRLLKNRREAGLSAYDSTLGSLPSPGARE